MQANNAKSEGGWSAAVRCTLLALAATAVSGGAAAQGTQETPAQHAVHLASASIADLEQAFWVCDYTAATRRASDVQIGICADAYDALKARKFAGDFEALLLWWQHNKADRYARLKSIESSLSESRPQ
jgi:hypothetical protein